MHLSRCKEITLGCYRLCRSFLKGGLGEWIVRSCVSKQWPVPIAQKPLLLDFWFLCPLGQSSKPHRPCSYIQLPVWAKTGGPSPGAPSGETHPRQEMDGHCRGVRCAPGPYRGPVLWERTGETFRGLDVSLPWALNAPKSLSKESPMCYSPSGRSFFTWESWPDPPFRFGRQTHRWKCQADSAKSRHRRS